MPKPAMKLTLSLTISSCARRLVLSGKVASSLTMTSIFLPATVSPFCCMYSLTALSICLPVDAWPPVIGRIRPIFTVSCACAGAHAAVPGDRNAGRGQRQHLGANEHERSSLIGFVP